MSKNVIGIVILNYLNFSDTIECVDSLLKQSLENQIVIVDNFSNNKSVEILTEKYCKNKNIHIIETEKNLGYAKGNNIGINYFRSQDVYDVLVLNNDTIIEDINFMEKMSNLRISKNIGAIGPKIIGSDFKNQNPVYEKTNFLIICKHLLLFQKIRLKNFFLREKKENEEKKEQIFSENMDSLVEIKKKDEYILHGSAILLTRNYLKEMSGLFPETFLYYEENILFLILKKMNLNMMYVDDLVIFHKEDQSSNLVFSNGSKQYIKYFTNSLMIALKVSLIPLDKVKKIINS